MSIIEDAGPDYGRTYVGDPIKKRDESTIDRIRALVEGNPGAASVLGRAVFEYRYGADVILDPLEENDIRGHHIWTLYKDRCDKNIAAFAAMLSQPDTSMLRKLSEVE